MSMEKRLDFLYLIVTMLGINNILLALSIIQMKGGE